MRKIIYLLTTCWLMLATVHPANAAVSDYLVNSFDSQIEINQDTPLSVTETIEVFFNIQKHGIFRIIPVVYSAGGKTIKARLIISSITNAQGQPYKYTTSRLNQSLQIKIGDPNSTLTGRQTYVIKYTIKDVLLSFKDHAEVYWNINRLRMGYAYPESFGCCLFSFGRNYQN